ncbi:alpha/beta hydrolase domain-containing protein 17B-like [Ipomoea triloba]|uniref:alpha/beta hydrolase domain-containing protein 17B-like n=1 Tax=Ipomoea triloba TaxID=35885 RepID=UPI00125CEB78|nr:alpha/beta hydrolase domain-containing protein 17B-like [Ipomoea triloba]
MGCLVSQLAAKFAFFPPSPATYEVKKRDDGRLAAVSTASSMPISDDPCLDVLLLDTKRGNKIVAFYLKNPYARLTMLYSHGNAADLGHLYDLFLQLKANLRVNLMGYDYSGYGASNGKPSEFDTYADIEAVYECLQTEYGVSQEDLILYGQSVGSGPTLHLAARLPRLRGVVLHSGILSGLRVLCHVKFAFCCDIYKNVNKIRKVKSPVLVIHGTEDDVVNWLHGDRLCKMARDPYEPLWIKGGGHCNLELYPDYIRHLCRFVQEMENMNTKAQLQKIRQTLPPQNRSNTAPTCCCNIKCPKPRCTKCSCWPKCPEFSKPSCTKCLECSKPSCTKCWCWPKCLECSKPSCTKCWCWPKWRLKCPKWKLKCGCLQPSCIKCSCWWSKCSCRQPKCWCW